MIAAVVVFLALLIGGAVMMSGGGNTAGQAELTKHCEAIRQAELAHKEAFESFVSADAAPRDPVAVDGVPVTWKPTRGFKKLSWEPEGDVLGSYTVTAKSDGFTVVGVADADGDGKQARCEATHTTEAKLTSAADIY